MNMLGITGMALIDLMQTCAPNIAPTTLAAIVRHESGWNPHALHNNTLGSSIKASSKEEAVAVATKMIKAGQSVDMGLGQINSQHLSKYKLSVEQVLDPCTNLRITQDILLDGWKVSGGNLIGTLSAYNTGKTNSARGYQYAMKILNGPAATHYTPTRSAQSPQSSPLAPNSQGLKLALKD